MTTPKTSTPKTKKKTRYMRELRKMVADIMMKKPKKVIKTKYMTFIGKEYLKDPCIISEYNIVDTVQDRTLGLAIKVKNIKRFSEKIENRGWKVIDIKTHKNLGSGKELPLSIFTIRK